MKWIVGVDEAGRGPLAGPVAVGAVVVPEGLDLFTLFPYLNDSKKLSEKRREEIFTRLQEEIRSGVIKCKVVLTGAAKIDAHGIASCIRGSITYALQKIAPEPTGLFVYLDGGLHAPNTYTQETVVGGDARIPSIMLASIAAKVTRDRFMKKIAEQHPEYGFEEHKGYGTKKHFEALRMHGLCDIHRNTFIHLDRVSG